MYTLIVFQMLVSQWNTDISNTIVPGFSSEQLCITGSHKIIETLNKMHKYDSIEYLCIKTGAGY